MWTWEIFEVVARSFVLTTVVKATAVVSIGLLTLWMARKCTASVRHLLLSCTFAILFSLVFANFVAPKVRIELPARPAVPYVRDHVDKAEAVLIQTTSSDTSSTMTAASSALRISVTSVFWLVWSIGVVAVMGQILLALLRMRRLCRSGLPFLQGKSHLRALAHTSGVDRPLDVLLHHEIKVPVTAGVLRPVVMLPEDATSWDHDELQRVLVHELEHIRRGDWLVHLCARSVCAIYWFHPLTWIAWRRLCLEAERACDDAVVLRAERTDYADQLVGLARRLSTALATPALSMANRSDLSKRVSAILDPNQARGRIGVFMMTIIFTAAAIVLLGVAPGFALSRAAQEQSIPSVQKAPRKEQRPRVLDRSLVEAAETGDIADIVLLLNAGANVNAAVDGDGSALIVAAKENHKAAVELLLNRGADPNLGVEGDGNALIMAAREGHEEIVNLLLDRGAIIDRIVPGDENALIQASSAGELGVVKLLVSRGADVNARAWSGGPDGEWRTPLNMARRRGNRAIIDLLTAAGARE